MWGKNSILGFERLEKVLKSASSLSVDWVPVLGHIKSVLEAIRGVTASGFVLNDQERGLYIASNVASVAKHMARFHALGVAWGGFFDDTAKNPEVFTRFSTDAVVFATASAVYWATFLGARARETRGAVSAVRSTVEQGN